jgi:phage gp36-like protein
MYTSQQDLEAALTPELVEQSADDGTGQLDPAIVAAVCERATSLCDSYLAGRYVVPLAPVPSVVVAHATAIAAYLLLSRRGFVPKEEDAPIERLYRDALKWLADVAAGRAHVPGLAQGPSAPSKGVAAASRPQVFTSELLDRY